MNGVASASQESLSFLQMSQNSIAGVSDTTGAGSTLISNEQSSSSLQDSSLSIGSVSNTDNPSTSQQNISVATESTSVNPGDPQIQLAQNQNELLQLHKKDETPEAEVIQVDPIHIKEGNNPLLEQVNGQVSLLEHTHENGVGAGDPGLIGAEETQDWIPESDELKRVKVYELVGSRWIDKGTAFCFGQFSEDTNQAHLIARSERNYNDLILTTAIRSNDVYQRQQETLIVWTEPDGVDYALSFQDPEGCAEVWQFIIEVQRHMNTTEDQSNLASSPLLDPDTSVTTASIIRSGHLPTPQLGIISEIERAIKSLARTQLVKERICEYIQQEEYIKSMIEVMHQAEELESLENLHALCSLMQTILMLNDHGMYEHILEDEIFFGVVGMLEYDPDFPGHKANYREFLHNTAQFHQPILVRDVSIRRKIHHTYRLQFLKDVVLARALDDSTFNVLNSCIIFNQLDIINHIQQDGSLLREAVCLFADEELLYGKKPPPNAINPNQHPHHIIISLNGHNETETKPETSTIELDSKSAPSGSKSVNGSENTPDRPPRNTYYGFSPPDWYTEQDFARCREVILLFQQLAIMGKNIQLPARLNLFRTLVDRGVLFAVQWAIGRPEKEEHGKQMISAGGEIFAALLEHDVLGVRSHTVKQILGIEKERSLGKKGADKAESLLDMVCRVMAQSRDLAVQSQIGDCLKSWLEVPAEVSPNNSANGSEVGPKPAAPARKDEPNTERFLEHFYKGTVHILLKPLTDLQEWKNFTDPVLVLTREEANRYVYLCELLHNFIMNHSFRSHFHIMSSDILSRVATLFKAKDKHLRHAAFKIMRALFKQPNVNAHTQLVKYDLFKPILDLSLSESLRDNLINSCSQEFFEFIRKNNLKDLIKFCMVRHRDLVEKLAKQPLAGEIFDLLIRRYEINENPPTEKDLSEPQPIPDSRPYSGPGRLLDLDEDEYFNTDDDEESTIPSINTRQWLSGNTNASPLPSNNMGMKRRRRQLVSTKNPRPPLKSPQLNALVDYADEDDELPSESTIAPQQLDKPEQQPASLLEELEADLELFPSSPPPKRMAQEDEEENRLESLARNAKSVPPSPSANAGPVKSGEKRRRAAEEDDEDDLLQRKSSKKLDSGAQKEGSPSIPGRPKNGDDPPAKKMKVKFGAVGLAVASGSTPVTTNPPTSTTNVSPSPTPTTPPSTASSPSPTSTASQSSEPGTKDGDTG
ncbi:component of IIS longevity pathway SMK-1-domain-containing protein [Panaeolus papilionaceus]|nr:component of IIS longevity pathway SMK-1-domain-containing protein [Panaeolus papilionaceus]